MSRLSSRPRRLPLLAFLLTACAVAVPACTTTPSVTTESERAIAEATLTTAESVLTGLMLAGKVTPAEHAVATQQLAELRALVASSATVPVRWLDVYQRVLNFGMTWAARSAVKAN